MQINDLHIENSQDEVNAGKVDLAKCNIIKDRVPSIFPSFHL